VAWRRRRLEEASRSALRGEVPDEVEPVLVRTGA
jgi:hypothetical protein